MSLSQTSPLDLLVCISTQQEITNVLPALEFAATSVLAFVTEYAHKQGWPVRLENALKADFPPSSPPSLDFRAEPVSKEEEHDPHAFAAHVLQVLEPHISPPAAPESKLQEAPWRIGFAWGGGQKPMSTGLWLAYETLAKRQPQGGHLAVYADATQGQMLVWSEPSKPPRSLSYKKALSLSVRLASYGMQPTSRPHGRLWPLVTPPFPSWLPEAYELFMHEPEYRRFCFELAAAPGQGEQTSDGSAAGFSPVQASDLLDRLWKEQLPCEAFRSLFASLHLANCPREQPPSKALLHNLLDPFRKELQGRLKSGITRTPKSLSLPSSPRVLTWLRAKNPENSSLAGSQSLFLAPEEKKFSLLFEKFMAYRVWLWLQKNKELVEDARFNLECQMLGGKNVLAEFDVLLLSRKGKLIALDAKSFEVDPQKQKAQTAKIQEIGGISTGFRFCFPMFKDDTGTPDIREDITMWGEKPWYPRPLLMQIATWKADTALKYRDALPLLPFDETTAFEDGLTHLC